MHLRKSLHPERWREILGGLKRGDHFICHKTGDETGDGSNLICAGAMEWQHKRGLTSQYERVCERLEYSVRKKGGTNE